MLKKQLCLTRKELAVFFARRFRVFRGDVVLLRTSRNQTAVTKAAFVVSSSVKRNAPARNMARRRLNEVVREIYPRIVPGFDLVFSIALTKKTSPSFHLLKDDTIKLLSLCGAL